MSVCFYIPVSTTDAIVGHAELPPTPPGLYSVVNHSSVIKGFVVNRCHLGPGGLSALLASNSGEDLAYHIPST